MNFWEFLDRNMAWTVIIAMFLMFTLVAIFGGTT